VSAQGISTALSVTLWAYVAAGAGMGGYLAWIALRTSEAVMRAKAPGVTKLAYERGMTIKAFVIKIGAPAAFLFWPVIVFMLAKGDSE
jgi:threonine/homoserine/homoserine lactone efflux protein